MDTHIPLGADTLQRPRLYRLMEAPWRIVLVTGQAAQGKTTLVADFLNSSDTATLWFHLDRAASDHGVLFERIARGMARAERASDQPRPLQIPLGTRKDLVRQVEILVTGLARGTGALNLVFDDMETLDRNGTALEFIQCLIEGAPDRVRFFLLSRQQPGINLGRFKIKKQVLTLGNEDLAFTREEARAFFEHLDDPSTLGGDEIDRIMTATEGWIGGLVLVAESIRISLDLDQLPDRLSTEAFSYFSDEIYRSLSPAIREFLMKTALFDELDTRILTSFFDTLDPRSILARLERRNLFIRKIRAGNRWPVYKYNNLFREFLMSDLVDTLDKDTVQSLNRRAGQIYWEQRVHDRAVAFFQAAGEFEAIAGIIRIKGADDLIQGRGERLFDWINALPDRMRQSDPWLIFFATAARRIKGGKKNIAAFQRALGMFEEKEDIRGVLLCLAYLIEASVFIRQPSHKIHRWILKGEQVLGGMKGQHRFTWARTLLWQQIGLGYITGNGDIPRGISACRNAILLARGIHNQDLVLNASIILTLGFVQSGDFSAARHMLEKVGHAAQGGRYPEYRALKNITNIDFALKKGDLDLAGDLLDRSEADIEKFGLIFLYPGFVEAKAVYLAARGKFDQAVQSADHLADFSILEGNGFYLGIAHRIRALAYLLQERYDKAREEAESAVRDLGRLMRGDIHMNLARQILGITMARLGEADSARTVLEKVLAYFKGIGSDLSFCETALTLGVLAGDGDTAGYGRDGAAYLLAGFEKAAENRYGSFPLVADSVLAEAAVRAFLIPEFRDGPAAYLLNLTAGSLGPWVRQAILNCLHGTAKRDLPRIAGRLAPLYKASQPRVSIQTFGGFRVFVGGRTMDPSVFGGSKPLLLLKSMVLKGGRDIPKEVLIDALWPKASASAGEKNFKVNLHRLRKALEPDPVKVFGYVYVSQKAGRASLDPELVFLDVRIFSDLAARGRDHLDRGDAASALSAFSKAAALYKGGYFEEDPYLEWVGLEREFYHRKCIEVLTKKAALHRELGQPQDAMDTWQAVLGLDSCHEEAFQQLMILYAEAGLKSDALKIFDQCRAILKRELDTAPTERTLAVYKRIKDRF